MQKVIFSVSKSGKFPSKATGIGYIDDCPISKLYRDIRAYRIGAGTDQIMIHIAGRLLVKKYAAK